MKSVTILFCGLVFAQGLKIEDTQPFEKEVEEVLVPLIKEYNELNTLIEEVKQHQQTEEISSQVLAERIASLPPHCLPTDTQFIEAWDKEGCQKLQTTLKKALDLGEVVTDWALKTGLTIFKEIYHIVRCGNINPVKAIQCVIKNVNDIKETINVNKPVAEKYKNEIVAMGKELKAEFKQCLGVQKKTEAIAKQIAVQAQLCDNMYPLRQH